MGPAPTDWDDRGPALSESRAAVLSALRAVDGPVAVTDLAVRMSLHPNTVREHLDALLGDGLATREAEPPRGRGRPAWLYTSAEPTADVRARDYSALAAALARHIDTTSRAPAADALRAGQEWGRELAIEREPARRSQPAVRREVVTMLAELGFSPAAGPGTRVVRLRQCPLLAAAQRFPEVVCSVHLGIVQGAMTELGGHSDRTSMRAFAEPGACVLRMDATDGG
jgi:predicted ArsR family transcriptional regulator